MSRTLAAWAIGSIAAAATFWLAADADPAWRRFTRAIGAQCLIWGLIDLLLAGLGLVARRPADPSAAAAENARVMRILAFNARINWFWLGCGVVLLVAGFSAWIRGSVWAWALAGHGAGVLVQGGFLFWFDRDFLRRMVG